MNKGTPESYVLSSVCEYLAVKGYVFWRQNNAGVYDVRNQRFRAMPTYSMKGVADVQVIVEGKSWFIECKAPKGVQSPDQKEFEYMVKRAGAEYHIVRSIDDLEKLGF